MEKLYRTLLLVLAIILLFLIALDVYYVLVFNQASPLPFVPVTRSGRLFGVLIMLVVSFVLVVSLIVVRKRIEYHNGIIRSIVRLYKLVFDGLSTGIIVLDRYAKIRYINPVFCRFIGCDEQEMPHLVHYSRIVDPMLQPVSEKLAQAVDSGEEFTREYRVFLPDGIRCFKCSFYGVNDEQLGTIRIITLEDRTREDAIKQKLSRQLEETHRHAVARDNFFANMSHEIRTPINAVLGMAYFAKKISDNEKCRGYIQKIENASELLLGVVNDILDFSRMQESKFTLNSETFNLYDLRKILTDLFALKAQQKGIDFLVEFNCPDPLPVYGDQFRLTQIFMNLAANAIKFTERGVVAVALNYEKVGEDIILRCSVRDTGCGISEEEIGKIFTDFEQFGQVLVKSHEGTGLGLAICKRLVELMGGVIWVDSTPGKGSSFFFVVLLKDPEKQRAEHQMVLPRIRNRHGQVLVIEAGGINGEIAATLLNSLGYIGVQAKSVEEALAMCRNTETGYFDAVLLDSFLAGQYGDGAVTALREATGTESPVLCILPEGQDESDIRKAGYDGHIRKPFKPEDFSALFPECTL